MEKLASDIGLPKIQAIFNVWYILSTGASQQVILLHDGSYICTCLLLQNNGIVCRHLFHLMTQHSNVRYHVSFIPMRWFKEYIQDDVSFNVESRPFCLAAIQQGSSGRDLRYPGKNFFADISKLFASLPLHSQEDKEEISRKRCHAEVGSKTKELINVLQRNPTASSFKRALTKLDEAIFEAEDIYNLDDPEPLRSGDRPYGAAKSKRLRPSHEQPKRDAHKCGVCGGEGHNARYHKQ